MKISPRGRLVDEPQIRAGFIGCGSHSFRNVYPTFQFAPVDLVSICDLDAERAKAFGRQFGAKTTYTDYHEMLSKEDLDAVFVVTNYDKAGQPTMPGIAMDCMRAGVHVWIEKPPASSCAQVEEMMKVSEESGKILLVGMKKMFFPANQKAKELMANPDFGEPTLLLFRYPQNIPTREQFDAYDNGENLYDVVSFVDHLCHPSSLMVYLLGMPDTMFYNRAPNGAGVAMFQFPSGAVASLALSRGASHNGGAEHTVITGRKGRHITVDNHIRVTYHRTPPAKYGVSPDFFVGSLDKASATWEPEFSFGSMYNKGLFLLGYYNEVNEFAMSILEGRKPANGTLEQAWQVTRIYEAFKEGPGKPISLSYKR